MKNTKFHIFLVWLMAITLLFSGIPLQHMFAEGSAATSGKDVSARLKFTDKLDAKIKKDNDFIFIYKEGELQQDMGEIKTGASLRFSYKWEMSKEDFNGNGTGEKVNAGDHFKILLPGSGLLNFLVSSQERPIVDGKNYGTWKVIKENDKYYIQGAFGDGIGSHELGQETVALEGFFEIEASAAAAGRVNLNPNTGGTPKPVIIIENLDFEEWKPGPFYKQGSYNATDKTISWSLITGFDNLKKIFEEPINEQSEVNKDSDKDNIAVWDVFPKGTNIKDIRLKVPVYMPTPAPDKNTRNYKDGKILPETDEKYIKEGLLSWRSHHEINRIYEYNNGNSPDLEIIVKSAPGTSLDDFKAAVKLKADGNSDGLPAVGVYQGETDIIVYAYLGSSPNPSMTYSQFYKVKKAGKKNISGEDGTYETLPDFLNALKDNGKISEKQLAIMKRAYLGEGEGGREGKILAWSVGITTKVEDMDAAYVNHGHCTYLSKKDTGGELKKEEDRRLVQFYRLKSGLNIFRRLSFPVTKIWKDSSGNILRNVDIPFDSIRVDVYRESADNPDNQVKSASILLTKENSWHGVVTGLPIYNDEGKPIKYIVKEEPVEGFVSTIAQNYSHIHSGYTITNTQKDSTNNSKNITVVKAWDSDVEKRPVTIYLEKKVVENTGTGTGTSTEPKWENVSHIELTEAGSWRHTFKGLDNNAEYRVKEKPMLGYKSSDPVENPLGTFTITNSYADPEPSKFVEIEVVKKWKHDHQLGSIVVELYSSKNPYPEKDENKTLEKTVILTHPNWSYSFGKYPTKIGSENIYYFVKEVKIDGFTSTPTKDESQTGKIKFTITNEPVPIPTGKIKVTKEWVKNDDTPASDVVVELLADGKIVKQIMNEDDPDYNKDTNKPLTITLNQGGNWQGVFENINLFSTVGKKLSFHVRERAIKGFEATVTSAEVSGDEKFAFTITNTQRAETKTIKVKKVWEGESSTDDKPEVTIKLTLTDKGGQTEVKTLKLNKDNQWKGEFKNITIVKKGGERLKVDLKEEPVTGYTSVRSGSIDEGFTFTNTKVNTPSVGESGETPSEPESTELGGSSDYDSSSSGSSSTPKTSTTAATTPTNTTGTSSGTSSSSTAASTRSTSDSTISSVSSSEASTETSSETTTDSVVIPQPSFIPVTTAEQVVVATTAPTAPTTPRTFEFIDIFEEVPLGVRTTAPLDLELVLIEESVPLSGFTASGSPISGFPFGTLPYTHSVPFEIIIGIGMLILTAGITIGRRL